VHGTEGGCHGVVGGVPHQHRTVVVCNRHHVLARGAPVNGHRQWLTTRQLARLEGLPKLGVPGHHCAVAGTCGELVLHVVVPCDAGDVALVAGQQPRQRHGLHIVDVHGEGGAVHKPVTTRRHHVFVPCLTPGRRQPKLLQRHGCCCCSNATGQGQVSAHTRRTRRQGSTVGTAAKLHPPRRSQAVLPGVPC